MTFAYSRQQLTPAERLQERCFEILPGAASWTILLSVLILSFWRPLLAAVLVIAIDLYWLLKLLYLTLFLVLSYVRLSVEQRTDWMARARGIAAALRDPAAQPVPPPARDWRERVSQWVFWQQVAALRDSGQPLPSLEQITHLVIIPIAKEAEEVIEPGLASLARQQFPVRQILVVLAVEERASAAVLAGVARVRDRYREQFRDVLLVVHPDGLPGEARVKGANATFGAKAAARYFAAHGIPFDHVIVSCLDADTVVGETYMACLTYHFMVCPTRTRASFQPIPVYHNNIWEAPAFARVLDIGSSFFQLVELTNAQTLVTFSSHSMSFKALVDAGYWPTDLISDDSAIFWKCFIHFDGAYRVIPMYVTLSMDIVNAGSWTRTAVHVYRQKRRWAWGVENFPIVARAFLRPSRIRLADKLRYSLKLLEGHVGWATWPILLNVIGWLPAVFVGREFPTSILYYSAPRITAVIFGLASLSLLTSIALSHACLPRPPGGLGLPARLRHTLEWLLVPPISMYWGALPALDAQTRLMLGRYMEFWVTEKRRAAPARAASPAVAG